MQLNSKLWLLWFVLTVSGAAVLVASMLYGGRFREHLLIGRTTDGHHQIELACDACHTKAFGGADALQKSCLNCHQAELRLAEDSHAARIFRDPRNAGQLDLVNATLCVSCHREHKPEIVRPMGVTLPDDNCMLCHADVLKERPTHKGQSANGCAAAGCHNYHDNRALFEDFIERHLGEPDLKAEPFLALARWRPAPEPDKAPPRPLARTDADAPSDKAGDPKHLDAWQATAHAKGGVNCTGCHAPKGADGIRTAWSDKPGREVCAGCHEKEAVTFLEGKHGMRLHPAAKAAHPGLLGLFEEESLSPMRPEVARLPMNPKAAEKELGCNTCHAAHAFDTRKAAVESCSGCHTDDHTKAYEGSPHHKAWLAELDGAKPEGSGVSCATCHMPRIRGEGAGGRELVFVTHHQNDNLRPNEKMVRSVCADCHGLQFTLDSLADKALIRRNFAGPPAVHVESLDWVERRLQEKKVGEPQPAAP